MEFTDKSLWSPGSGHQKAGELLSGYSVWSVSLSSPDFPRWVNKAHNWSIPRSWVCGKLHATEITAPQHPQTNSEDEPK